MRDGEMVAGTVAGDPAALADAYDHYAPALYAYCRSLLAEPAAAADAVYDTFIVAAAKLYGLRDPSRLRPWLYAVARNECQRLLQSRPAAGAFDDDDVPISDATADFGTALEQAEIRELVWSALSGLSKADREIIELTVRHEFYGADLADALGVPHTQAHTLATRARAQFETALGALLVARSEQGSCEGLAEILAGWDGELTVALRKQVRRHIESCATCGEHRRRDLSPVALFAELPVPVLPAGLRYQVLGLLTDPAPDAVAACTEVAARSEPFSRNGFPVPIAPLAAARGPATFMPVAGVLVAACAVFGGGAMLVANISHHPAATATSTLRPTVPSAKSAPPVSPPAQPTISQLPSTPPSSGMSLAAAPPASSAPNPPARSAPAAPPKRGKPKPPSTPPKTPPPPPPTTPPPPPPTTPPPPPPSP